MSKKKKWSREKCRERYVQGERIGQRELARISGRSASIISDWCAEDGWVEERGQYWGKLRAKTIEKTIEKTSDHLSDRLTEMNEEHLQGLEFFRKMFYQLGAILAKEVQETGAEQRADLAMNKEFSLAMQRYQRGYLQAVNMERIALGMSYLDLNKAIEAVLREGYDVTEPPPKE